MTEIVARRVDRLFPWLFGSLLVFYLGQGRFFTPEAVLALVAACFAGGVWRSAAVLTTGLQRRIMSTAFLASAFPGVAVILLSPVRTPTDVILQDLTALFLGWSFVLWLPLGRLTSEQENTASSLTLPKALLGLGLTGVFGALALCHWFLRGTHAVVIDEVLYILQSTLLCNPEYAIRVDPALKPFFAITHVIQNDDRLYTQYPPGWPTILALASAFNLRWWTNVILATAGVVFTYMIGRRLHSPLAGFIAAALLSTNYWFVFLASTYFAHIASLVLLVAAGWVLLTSESVKSVPHAVRWLFSGTLVGLAIAVRPLSGAVVGSSLVFWVLIRCYYSRAQKLLLVPMFILGALPPIVGLLYYNYATNGEPFVFGYQVANPNLIAFGFGDRGEIRYDDQGQPYEYKASFTPLQAIRNSAAYLREINRDFLPLSLVFPLLALGALSGYKIDWTVVGLFTALPAAHLFYFWRSLRFYSELLPFYSIGLALILAHLWRNHEILARRLLLFTLVCGLFMLPIKLRRHWYDYRDRIAPHLERVETAQQQHGRVLVFVGHPPEEPHLFSALYWFNATAFFGDVVIARDLGKENYRLISRFPAHTPVWINLPAGR